MLPSRGAASQARAHVAEYTYRQSVGEGIHERRRGGSTVDSWSGGRQCRRLEHTHSGCRTTRAVRVLSRLYARCDDYAEVLRVVILGAGEGTRRRGGEGPCAHTGSAGRSQTGARHSSRPFEAMARWEWRPPLSSAGKGGDGGQWALSQRAQGRETSRRSGRTARARPAAFGRNWGGVGEHAPVQRRGSNKEGHSEILHVQDLLARGCVDDTGGCRRG
jgi:hypothetical protein